MYQRHQAEILKERLEESRRFIQVLAGPRQVGKTTLVGQVLKSLKTPHHYASADQPSLRDPQWIQNFFRTFPTFLNKIYVPITVLKAFASNNFTAKAFLCPMVKFPF